MELLKVESRKKIGSNSSRSIRKFGLIPGILYGNDFSSEPITIEENYITKKSRNSKLFGKIYKVELNNNIHIALIKSVQLHPVTDKILHIDFMKVKEDSSIHIHVPVEFINEDKSPGIKRGGVLNIIHHSIEVISPIHLIPDKLILDLSGLDMNKSIMTDSLQLTSNIKVASQDTNYVIATIVQPSDFDTEKGNLNQEVTTSKS